MKTSCIFYVHNAEYLDNSIHSLLNNTDPDILDKIIVCIDEIDVVYSNASAIVLNTNRIGRSAAWNLAAKQIDSEVVVFINGISKFGPDWLDGLLLNMEKYPRSLNSTEVYYLDTKSWKSLDHNFKRFGYRWDLKYYNRKTFDTSESPAISSACIAIKKDWFEYLGGFDDGMTNGDGEDLEFSIRNYLAGGSIFISEGKIANARMEVESILNKARIAEAWFGKHSSLFYDSLGITRKDVRLNRIDDLVNKIKPVNSFDTYLNCCQPEMLGIVSLKNTGYKKRCAVIYPGASLDFINDAEIYRNDIIIGVDYAADIIQCDYIMTDNLSTINALRAKYKAEKFVLPMEIENKTGGKLLTTTSIFKDAKIYDLAEIGDLNNFIGLPLHNFGHLGLTAINFALYLCPEMVNVYGLDFKLLDGRSHSTRLEVYGDGKLFEDSEALNRNNKYYEYGMNHLGKIALKAGIPLMRYQHA